jgi:CheY-like chemotaxis protein
MEQRMADSHDPPATILVVEDEALIRTIGADMLEDEGFEVLEAASADEAIQILEAANDVRLVFSDVDMPGSMDGLALLELVHSRWPDIRLILTSGACRLSDADLPDDGRFVPKPYSRAAVMEEIGDLLQPGPAASDVA